MTTMRFSLSTVNLIMKCVRSVRLSFLINEVPYSIFTLTQGIQQEDPLSPYLFIICVDGLFVMIRHAERHNLFAGLRFRVLALLFSTYFFADNNALFCKANSQNA